MLSRVIIISKTNIELSLSYRGISHAEEASVSLCDTQTEILRLIISPSDTERVATCARDNQRREKQIGMDGIKMRRDNVTSPSIEDDQ